MNQFGERLFALRKEQKLARDALGLKIGVSKTAIKNWEDGSHVPKLEHMQSLAKVFKVSFDWLAYGKGNPNDQYITVPSITNVEKLPVRKIRQVPVLNWVQAGAFTEIGDNAYDEFEPVFEDDYGSKNIYWLKIRGDSMKPTFNEGDLILIDANRTAMAGNFVIAKVCDDEEATFKKFKPCGFDDNGKEYFQLIALNDFYPPIDSRYKPFEVIGVVVEHKRKLI